jgi:hypothetical protein
MHENVKSKLKLIDKTEQNVGIADFLKQICTKTNIILAIIAFEILLLELVVIANIPFLGFCYVLIYVFAPVFYLVTSLNYVKRNKSIRLWDYLYSCIPILIVTIVTFFYDGMTTAHSNPDSSSFLWFLFFSAFRIIVIIICAVIMFISFLVSRKQT